MRFKKGSKVEVLNKSEVPAGSWWSAEIISGNGHNYIVRYDRDPPDAAAAFDRVPRRAIRPCPPLTDARRNWVPGDIVEVFGNSSWKLAEVSRVVGRDYFFIRLLGSARQFRAHSSDLRLRQTWQDDKWVVIQQDSRRRNKRNLSRLSNEGKLGPRVPGLSKVKGFERNDFSPMDSRGVKKRPQKDTPLMETFNGAGRKMRAVVKEGFRHRLVAGDPLPQLMEKVDAVASPQNMLGEKYMHASFNNWATGCSDMLIGRLQANADDHNYFVTCLDDNDAQSISSSVGSCNTSDDINMSAPPISDLNEGSSSNCHRASLFSGSERGQSLSSKEVVAAEIHQLELHGYRSTMEALHASGPISWEQEALMTNLRLMLNISNDEHLLELRHLISGQKEEMPLRLS